MLEIYTCISSKHDLRLVVLAALICSLSAVTTLQAYARGRKKIGRERTLWLSLAGGINGSGVWATHFVAMLAYCPTLPIQYEVGGTAISLMIAMVGGAVGFFVAASHGKHLMLGSALVGLSVAAMHYSGISAIHSMFRLHWNFTFVAASLAVSVVGSAAALWLTNRTASLARAAGAATALVLAIVGLHFTGMAGVTLVPDMSATASPELMSRTTLAFVVSGVVILILLAALLLLLIEAQSRRVSMGALQSAFQGVPSGIALYDPMGKVVLWNEAFEALHRSFGAEISPELPRAVHTRPAVEAADFGLASSVTFQTALALPLEFWEGEVADGRWLRLERKLLVEGSMIIVLSEVTNLHLWAGAMKEARDNAEAASRAKSDFLANMSHEIRTPLNGVLGMIQAMKRDELSPAQRQRIEVAHDSGKALLSTLNDILDLAKVQAGRMDLQTAPFNLAELAGSVSAAFAGVAAVKGLTLSLDVDADADGWWLGDAPKLRQVLSNLIANAIKFTLEGAVTLKLSLEDGEVVVRVTDTGIGIDPSDAERLFEKFAQADNSKTRRFGGTGLGLAISRELMTLMGGRIWVESALGMGAAFSVAVALERGQAPTRSGEVSTGEVETEHEDLSLTILVAEDNPVNQLVIRSLLEPTQVALTVVANGEEAVEAFTRGRFDLVLMDIQMPQMSGIEACRVIRDLELRERRLRTPIIALTANVMHDQLEVYRAAGMNGYVPKPIEVERLYAALSEALEPEPLAPSIAA